MVTEWDEYCEFKILIILHYLLSSLTMVGGDDGQEGLLVEIVDETPDRGVVNDQEESPKV